MGLFAGGSSRGLRLLLRSKRFLALALIATLLLGRCQGAVKGIQAPSSSRHLLQKCTGGSTACGGTCVDVKSDPNNCGNCGAECATGQVCKNGRCQCPTSQKDLCSSTCTDTKTDANNCGACGAVCTSGSTCQSGHCACPNGDKLNTSANCGSCGYACADGQTCSDGICCKHCGGSACIDLLTDKANCGACGASCPAPASLYNVAEVSCYNGTCIISKCTSDEYKDCNGVLSDGCEVNLKTDAAHCGSCNTTAAPYANAAPTCVDGASVLGACIPGYQDCNSWPDDGCETFTAEDPYNCGGCGLDCPADNRFKRVLETTCANSSCAITSCRTGFVDCDGDYSNGCEAGGQATMKCVDKQPVIVACNEGWWDCDGNPTNGCEVFATTSPHGTLGCVDKKLAILSCETGFENCDGNARSGCEAELSTDTNHCGSCTTPVAPYANAFAACVGGARALGACYYDYKNCNNVTTDGCEAHLVDDPNNCGDCGVKCAVDVSKNVASITCKKGVCVITGCQAGYTDCNEDPADGCEVKAGDGTCVKQFKLKYYSTYTQQWTAPAGVTQLAEILVVAGGGGGGGNSGGGGGAGGVIYKTNYPVTPGTTYTINVGEGGYGGDQDGGVGGDSVFSAPNDPQNRLRAYGGGRGLAAYGSYFSTGGSGGGKTVVNYVPAGYSAAIDPAQGNPGGMGSVGHNDIVAGGGGGAGGMGQDASLCGGAGGPGAPITFNGVTTWYAAGGGGSGIYCGGAAGAGGTGAGGSLADRTTGRQLIIKALAGRPDSGDGGGGQGYGGAGGGSGIVILRY